MSKKTAIITLFAISLVGCHADQHPSPARASTQSHTFTFQCGSGDGNGQIEVTLFRDGPRVEGRVDRYKFKRFPTSVDKARAFVIFKVSGDGFESGMALDAGQGLKQNGEWIIPKSTERSSHTNINGKITLRATASFEFARMLKDPWKCTDTEEYVI